MNQYHVFKTECNPEHSKAKVVNVKGCNYTTVLSNGIVTGNCSSEEYQILRDCRPGSKFEVVQAKTHEQAAELGAKKLK